MPWRKGQQRSAPEATASPDPGREHLAQAEESLRALVDDPTVPAAVRGALAGDFEQVEDMLEKIEQGHLHIAAFGRVGVGKSALLNTLLGEPRFSTSALHGETREAQTATWREADAGGVMLIDTPGINEVGGEERERLAHDVAARCDLILFVVDGDLSDTELDAIRTLVRENRSLLLVLNKSDRYTATDLELVLDALAERTAGLVPANNIVACAALPAERIYVMVGEDGAETETLKRPPNDVQTLRDRLWSILETEGKTLAALNASLFAGKLSEQLATRVIATKKELANRVVRNYCLAKGILVGCNPIPVADLLAAATVDVALTVHLSRLYGVEITRHEAGQLVKTIATQMTLLMGTVWGVHLVSSALKGASFGLSTVLTSAAQGAVAYYATYAVGQAAHRYFELGKSWGDKGPKRMVQEILDSIDRDSLLAEAREEILARLRVGAD